MLSTAYALDCPSMVRYPRGSGTGAIPSTQLDTLPVGKGEVRRHGKGVALLAFGTLLAPALAAGDEIDATVANMRFVKPIDADLIVELARNHSLLVTLEENAVIGGAGSEVERVLAERGLNVPVLRLGLPDRFIDHGEQGQLLAELGLDKDGIVHAVRSRTDKR
jgi:1-deoxy-D-xylulose-5-phosphate synthase